MARGEATTNLATDDARRPAMDFLFAAPAAGEGDETAKARAPSWAFRVVLQYWGGGERGDMKTVQELDAVL